MRRLNRTELISSVCIPGLISRCQSIIGNPIDQSITIDDNYLTVIDCHRPIDDQSDNHKLESSNCYRLPLIAIDYHRLSFAVKPIVFYQ